MTKLLLASGDVFFVKGNKGFLRRGINFFQKKDSADGYSETPHTGWIRNAFGQTFESLSKICSKNLYEEYKGTEIEIYRHKSMTPELAKKGFASVKHLDGKSYPWWRFIWFMSSKAEKIHLIHRPVCSELVSWILISIGLLKFKTQWGVDVDELYDHIKNHDDWDVVYKGII